MVFGETRPLIQVGLQSTNLGTVSQLGIGRSLNRLNSSGDPGSQVGLRENSIMVASSSFEYLQCIAPLHCVTNPIFAMMSWSPLAKCGC